MVGTLVYLLDEESEAHNRDDVQRWIDELTDFVNIVKKVGTLVYLLDEESEAHNRDDVQRWIDELTDFVKFGPAAPMSHEVRAWLTGRPSTLDDLESEVKK